MAMPFRPLVMIAFAAVLACSGAAAQPPAPPPPPASPPSNPDVLVEGLMVQAARPGPAFWKISKGDSVVWLMGIPSSLPRGLQWNQSELRARMKGANVLILPPDIDIGNIFSLTTIFLFQRDRLRAEAPLDKTLPPDLRVRYDKATGRKPGDAYPDYKPILAAWEASYRFTSSLNLRERQPERTINRLAPFGLRTERAGRAVVLDFIRLFMEMPRDMELACLNDSLTQVESGKDRFLEAARGWARGDLRVAVSADRGWDQCLNRDPKVRATTESNIQAAVDAITRALDKPGKSVAIVGLQDLLAQNGAIVRLKARGFTVTAPDAPGIGDDGFEQVEPIDDDDPAPAAAPARQPMP